MNINYSAVTKDTEWNDGTPETKRHHVSIAFNFDFGVTLEDLRYKQTQSGYAPSHAIYEDDMPYVEPTQEELDSMVPNAIEYCCSYMQENFYQLEKMSFDDMIKDQALGFIANFYC